MTQVKYYIKQISDNNFDLVKPLWEKLNEYHFNLSPNFKQRFKSMSWEKRKNKLMDKSQEMLVECAVDTKNNIIGYCISTIDKIDNSIGEVDSLFVEEKYRKHGIGKELINNALKWFDSKNALNQKLLVGAGNEKVIKYYEQFDFYPLHIVLQKK
jgi:diamine N-acetyltransferase